ncbi:MAG: hypothetical protein RRB24_11390 [Armatimonadota bacterium]|nr:hypothetical protein [Armatimonadota bacterium]MDT7973420.1 hypothetical protein [Armatimonadota bacterium]
MPMPIAIVAHLRTLWHLGEIALSSLPSDIPERKEGLVMAEKVVVIYGKDG